MAWFKKERKPKQARDERSRSSVPEGLWVRCDGCREIIFSRELEKNLRICPKCGFHFRIDVDARIALLIDDVEPAELFAGIRPVDPLGFADSKRYADRLKTFQKALGVADAVRVVTGGVEGIPVVLAAMDYRFIGGSMGSVVGEKITRAAEHAIEQRRPLVVVSASGGARMQEGVLSLMQMAKISAALGRLREARLPYVSVLTDPTTGGVTASFAMLGDVNIAEPGALIGFAGPRVIEQTIRQSLPEGFQRSEFLLEHGFLDLVVPRPELKSTVARCLRHLA
ncbi:MAG: acetyl-CoA carboxylase carboxyltransferase subunit beta [Thermoanaerobaculia bacterium]|nr:MAG: acetyl-CoA carboxylase carboxyltransferase subunit beta [Thermoanaerobaculia bacterium]MBZ0102489.1 acetyl-CoA carboxylase, carboxyltransferase subunit beta [Thermoanaerobaculia bacterium]